MPPTITLDRTQFGYLLDDSFDMPSSDSSFSEPDDEYGGAYLEEDYPYVDHWRTIQEEAAFKAHNDAKKHAEDVWGPLLEENMIEMKTFSNCARKHTRDDAFADCKAPLEPSESPMIGNCREDSTSRDSSSKSPDHSKSPSGCGYSPYFNRGEKRRKVSLKARIQKASSRVRAISPQEAAAFRTELWQLSARTSASDKGQKFQTRHYE